MPAAIQEKDEVFETLQPLVASNHYIPRQQIWSGSQVLRKIYEHSLQTEGLNTFHSFETSNWLCNRASNRYVVFLTASSLR